MRQTLFYIPETVAGWPLFGVGILLAVWAVIGAVLLVVTVRRQGWTQDTLLYLAFLAVVSFTIGKIVPGIAEPGRGLPVRGYGAMLLAGTLGGVALAVQRARARGISADVIYSLASWMFVAGILGARLFYVIEYWSEYQRATWTESLAAMLNIAQGGLVVYGSVLGAAAAFAVFIKRNKLPLLATSDLIVPSLLVGLSLGRIGCFLNGCCFGGVCDLPWAVQFPWNSPPHQRQVHEGLLYLHGLKVGTALDAPPIITAVEPDSAAAHAGLAVGQRIITVQGTEVLTAGQAEHVLLDTYGDGTRLAIRTSGDQPEHAWTLSAEPARSLSTHPTQLYSAIDAALIVIFLLVYEPYRKHDGELTALTFIIYPITRFLIEIIRTDESSVFGTGLSISQNISLVLLAASLVLWFWLRHQPVRA